MAAEHTFEDVYAASPSAPSERHTGVRRRLASAEHATEQLTGPVTQERTAWPFSTPAFVAALELADDAVVIIDRHGVIQYANGACRAWLERSHLEGARLFELITLEPRQLRAILRRLRDQPLWHGNVVAGLNTCANAQASSRELELSVGAVKLAERGPIYGFSVTVRIARDKRRLATRSGARDVFSVLARVAGEVAHDLNNHVAVVLNYSFILLRQLSSERPERAHVEELQQAAWRAAETARLLLRFAGKRSAQPSALDVNEVIRDAQAVLALISRSPTEIEQRLFPEPFLLSLTGARRSQLEWLLLELTQRLCARLGGLGKLRIATQYAARSREPQAGPQKRAPRIRILLDGYPRLAGRRLLGARSLPDEAVPDDASSARISEQLGYELALQPLADSGLRYAIELPGE